MKLDTSFFKGKKILITGHTGFKGSWMCKLLINAGAEVIGYALNPPTSPSLFELCDIANKMKSIIGDVRDLEHLKKVFEENEPEIVIHMAAQPLVRESYANPVYTYDVNVMGTVNLLNCAKDAWENQDGVWKEGVKFLHVSTDEVYGSLGDTGYFMETTPLDPHSPYSSSKASSDLMVKAYHDTYKMPINITRCSNNYGPFQFPEKLIPLLINNCLNLKDLPVYGDGLNIRDWLFVEDHAKAIDMVINNGRVGEVYNVGGHNERTNVQIVKTVIGYINENVDSKVTENLIKYVEDRKGHDRRYGIDPTKIKEELGWFPETTFEVGIKKTIKWYLDNKEWMENVTSGAYQKYYEKMYN